MALRDERIEHEKVSSAAAVRYHDSEFIEEVNLVVEGDRSALICV